MEIMKNRKERMGMVIGVRNAIKVIKEVKERVTKRVIKRLIKIREEK